MDIITVNSNKKHFKKNFRILLSEFLIKAGKIKKLLEVSKGNFTYISCKKKGNDKNFVALFYFLIYATLIAPFS